MTAAPDIAVIRRKGWTDPRVPELCDALEAAQAENKRLEGKLQAAYAAERRVECSKWDVEAKLQVIRELHQVCGPWTQPNSNPMWAIADRQYCRTCQRTWPCPTLRILDGDSQ